MKMFYLNVKRSDTNHGHAMCAAQGLKASHLLRSLRQYRAGGYTATISKKMGFSLR